MAIGRSSGRIRLVKKSLNDLYFFRRYSDRFMPLFSINGFMRNTDNGESMNIPAISDIIGAVRIFSKIRPNIVLYRKSSALSCPLSDFIILPFLSFIIVIPQSVQYQRRFLYFRKLLWNVHRTYHHHRTRT